MYLVLCFNILFGFHFLFFHTRIKLMCKYSGTPAHSLRLDWWDEKQAVTPDGIHFGLW